MPLREQARIRETAVAETADYGAKCRVCGHYETSLVRATEKYAHCPSCGRAPHWCPVKHGQPASTGTRFHNDWCALDKDHEGLCEPASTGDAAGAVPATVPLTIEEARAKFLCPTDNPVMNGKYVIGCDRRDRAICYAPKVTGDVLREIYGEVGRLAAKKPMVVYGYVSLMGETETFRFRQIQPADRAPVERGSLVPLSPLGEGAVPVCKACESGCNGEGQWSVQPCACDCHATLPVCKPSCGKDGGVGIGVMLCTPACRTAGRPLNRPPVAPVAPPEPSGNPGQLPPDAAVPAEAPLITAEAFEAWRRGDATAPRPAEPAKEPLSERVMRGISSVYDLRNEIASLQAELAEAKRCWASETSHAIAARAEVEHLKNQRDNLSIEATKLADEVEQLKARLADLKRDWDQGGKDYCALQDRLDELFVEHENLKREAYARVLAMRRQCTNWLRGKGLDAVAREIECLTERSPTSTGSASGSGGEGACHRKGCETRATEPGGECPFHAEFTAGAIKAAVDKANNRAADAFHAYHFHDQAFDSMDAADFEEWLRSGADAPGAGKDGGK